MKQINFNEHVGYCWGTLVLLLVFLNEFQYDDSTKEILIWTCGLLVFLPFEIVCGKIVWYVIRRTNFELKFLFSDRVVRIT